MSDDPFACFGDEDDSDVSSDEIVAAGDGNSGNDRGVAQKLINLSNNNMNRQLDIESKNSTPVNMFRSSYQDQKQRTAHLPWPDCPPLYLGPMHLDKSLSEGGGRGYVASHDLPPGTCVLIEEPLVDGWSDEQMGKRLGLESIRYLLQLKNAQIIVDSLLELHPKKEKVENVFQSLGTNQPVESLDRIQIVDMMATLEKDASFREEQRSLVFLAKEHNICNPDGTFLTARDINRLLLTLRYNGFESGLYLHFSMFNHNEDPNCIKFRPGEESSQTMRCNYSEARTTRAVKKGEALTLHYLENPREVSHATRRRIIWDQHQFDIGAENTFRAYMNSPRNIYESELVGGKFPNSSTQESTSDEDPPITTNIEKSLDDLEDMFLEIQQAFKSELSGDDKSSYFDRAAALELTLGELIIASKSALDNNNHILLARCRRMHLDVIELLLSNCSDILTHKQSLELMARFLQSVQPLLETLRKRCGNDHPDVARASLDFAMGIQTLLSQSPKRLLSLKLPEMTSVEQCSKMEHYYRSEKTRIEQMYPRDVANIIAMVQHDGSK